MKHPIESSEKPLVERAPSKPSDGIKRKRENKVDANEKKAKGAQHVFYPESKHTQKTRDPRDNMAPLKMAAAAGAGQRVYRPLARGGAPVRTRGSRRRRVTAPQQSRLVPGKKKEKKSNVSEPARTPLREAKTQASTLKPPGPGASQSNPGLSPPPLCVPVPPPIPRQLDYRYRGSRRRYTGIVLPGPLFKLAP